METMVYGSCLEARDGSVGLYVGDWVARIHDGPVRERNVLGCQLRSVGEAFVVAQMICHRPPIPRNIAVLRSRNSRRHQRNHGVLRTQSNERLDEELHQIVISLTAQKERVEGRRVVPSRNRQFVWRSPRWRAANASTCWCERKKKRE
jgi:hypothetical protein